MMYYNPMLERWANTLPIPLPDAARRMPGGGEQASLMPYKNLDEEQQQHQTTGKLYTEEKSPGKISFVGWPVKIHDTDLWSSSGRNRFDKDVVIGGRGQRCRCKHWSENEGIDWAAIDMAATRRITWTTHVGHRPTTTSLRLLHHAQLSSGEVEVLVLGLLFPQHVVDLHLLIRDGLDDHHHRYCSSNLLPVRQPCK